MTELVDSKGAGAPDESSAAGERLFRVVVNGEEQYSVWPAERELPQGWSQVGAAEPRDACLQRIEELWTDIRPKSVRELTSPPNDG